MSRAGNLFYSGGGSRAPTVAWAEPRQTLSPPPSSPPAEHTGFFEGSRGGPRPAREVYQEEALRHHPEWPVPQDDVRIVLLGSYSLDNFSAQDRDAWLEREWEDTIAAHGSEAAARAGIKRFLDAIIEPTGTKPGPEDTNVQYIDIPDDSKPKLSLRFWPGSLADAEYCMDFVETVSKTPCNAPEKYRLWAIPDPAMPWMAPITAEIVSLERSHGFKREDIVPGEEKFILRDGMYCQLVSGKHPILRFRAPGRYSALIEDNVPTAEARYY